MTRQKLNIILLIFVLHKSMAQDGGFWWKKEAAKNHTETHRTSKNIPSDDLLELIFGKNEPNEFKRFDDCIEAEEEVPDFIFPDDEMLSKILDGSTTKEAKRKCTTKNILDSELIPKEQSTTASQKLSTQNKGYLRHEDKNIQSGTSSVEPPVFSNFQYKDQDTKKINFKPDSYFPTYSSSIGPIPIPIEHSENAHFNVYKVPSEQTNNHHRGISRPGISEFSLDKPNPEFSTNPSSFEPIFMKQNQNVYNYNNPPDLPKLTYNHSNNGYITPFEIYTPYSNDPYAKPINHDERKPVGQYVYIPLVSLKVPTLNNEMSSPYYMNQNNQNVNWTHFFDPSKSINQNEEIPKKMEKTQAQPAGSYKDTQDGISRYNNGPSYFYDNAQEPSTWITQPISQTNDDYKRSMDHFPGHHQHPQHFHHHPEHFHHNPEHFHHHPHHHYIPRPPFHPFHSFHHSHHPFHPANYEHNKNEYSGSNINPSSPTIGRTDGLSNSRQSNNQNNLRNPPINNGRNPPPIVKSIENFVKNVGVVKVLVDAEKKVTTNNPRQNIPITRIPVSGPKTANTTTPRSKPRSQIGRTTTPRTIVYPQISRTTTPRTIIYPQTGRITTPRMVNSQNVRPTTPRTRCTSNRIRTTTPQIRNYTQTIRTTTPTTTSFPFTVRTTIPVTRSYLQTTRTTTPVTKFYPRTIKTTTLLPYPEAIRTSTLRPYSDIFKTTPKTINYPPNIPDVHSKDEIDGDGIDYYEIFEKETTENSVAEDCTCVANYLCNDGVINVDGFGVLDLRFSVCPNDNEVCCKLLKKSTTTTESVKLKTSTEIFKQHTTTVFPKTTKKEIQNTASKAKPILTESGSVQNNEDESIPDGLIDEIWPGLKDVEPEPITVDESNSCVCVDYFLCNDGVINMDGTGVIDLRFSLCPDHQVCCSNTTSQDSGIRDANLPRIGVKDNVSSKIFTTEANKEEAEIIDWDAFEDGVDGMKQLYTNNEKKGGVKDEEEGCVCVHSSLCADGHNNFGYGVISARFNACPEDNQVCCKKPLTSQS